MMALPTLLVLAPAALAHGGLHQSERVFFGPTGPALSTTYGLIHRAEDGEWSWVCEEVSGLNGDGWTFAVGPDGRWFLTGISGARTSADRCDWLDVGGDAVGRFVTRIAPDPTRADVVWAVTGNGDAANPVLRSDDGGLVFSETVEVAAGARLRSLRVADDGRLWVQGMIDNVVWAWTSADGAAWTGAELGAVDRGGELLDVGPDGSAWVVGRSNDGDVLWRVSSTGVVEEVLATDVSIHGVSAGPASDEVWIGGRELTLRGSMDGGATWTEAPDAPAVGCLALHDGTRWMCSDNWNDGAALSRVEVGEELGEWQDVLWFGDVHRVEPCAAGTLTADECDPLWADLDPLSGMDLDRPDTPDDDDEDPAGRKAGDTSVCGSQGGPSSALLLVPLLFGLRRRRRRG
jgi:hypothetical protein